MSIEVKLETHQYGLANVWLGLLMFFVVALIYILPHKVPAWFRLPPMMTRALSEQFTKPFALILGHTVHVQIALNGEGNDHIVICPYIPVPRAAVCPCVGNWGRVTLSPARPET
jgi:hypothetical protein